MKYKFIIPAIVFLSLAALARVVPPFANWEHVESASSSIVVVKCGKQIAQDSKVPSDGGPDSDSEVEILAILKGSPEQGRGRLQTDHELREGECYLVFGDFKQNIYTAYE